jgi:hypothetical protein
MDRAGGSTDVASAIAASGGSTNPTGDSMDGAGDAIAASGGSTNPTGDSMDGAEAAVAASGGSTNPMVGSMDRAVHSMSMSQVRRTVPSIRPPRRLVP